MIAAAQIIFLNRRGDACLPWLSRQLRQMSIECTDTEWRGHSMVVPQLLVPTRPVSLTIQVDESPEYVPDELAELAEEARGLIDAAVHAKLAACNARLDIMSTTPPRREEDDRQVTVWAQTDLDPQSPDVERVLVALSAATEGFVVDCVNGRLRPPGSNDWIRM